MVSTAAAAAADLPVLFKRVTRVTEDSISRVALEKISLSAVTFTYF
jgi:hypothetical protein